MIKAYIAIELSNGNTIKYVRDVVTDSAGVDNYYYKYKGPGYQELGLDQVSSYDNSGLKENTAYYFIVSINGAAQAEYSITTGTRTTFGDIVNLMNNQISADGAKFEIRRTGDIRCYSLSSAASTSIELSVGTTGTDLFTSLKGFSSFDTATPGEQYADLTTGGKIKSDYDSLVTSLTGSTAPYELLLFPESAGSTTELIRKSHTNSNGELGEIHLSIPVGQIVLIEVIEGEEVE